MARGDRRISVSALLPNIVTMLGLCAGLTSIRFAFDDQLGIAAVLLIVAALIDGFDGMLARKLNAASPFGAELDSLSDFVCFGVAPAMVVYTFGLSGLGGFGWLAALFFAVCCCMRLARFNVMAKEDDPTVSVSFKGVPAPAGAMLGLFPIFLKQAGMLDLSGAPIVVAIWMLMVGGMMVGSFRTVSSKALKVSRENVVWVMLAAALVIGFMLTRLWLFCVLSTVIYLGLLIYGVLRGQGVQAQAGAAPEDDQSA